MSVVWEQTVNSKADVEKSIAEYARQQHRERERRWKADNPDAAHEQRARHRANHKTPIRIQYDPPPITPPVPDWREQLDQRITRCHGCDQWQWDNRCQTCMTRIRRAA